MAAEIGTVFIRLSILRALWVSNGLIEGAMLRISPSTLALLPLISKADGLARVLVSPLTSLQLGLRFLAVLYFSEELTYLLAKKRLP